MKATPLPTRSVTIALTLMWLLLSGPSTQTNWAFLIPRSEASAGLISMNMSCCSSASHLLERVSSPPPSYSTSRPEVKIIGNCFGIPLSATLNCRLLASWTMRKSRRSSIAGYLFTRAGRADELDDLHLLRRQLLVPAELLQHGQRELGIAVLEVRALGVGALGQQVHAV